MNRRSGLVFALVVASFTAGSAFAHAGHHPAPPAATGAESFWNSLTAVCLAGVALLYLTGFRKLRASAGGKQSVRGFQAAAFLAGVASAALALLSSLDRWSDVLFSAHMAQHEILMLISAPLMVLGRPFIVSLWALPQGSRQEIGVLFHQPVVSTLWNRLSGPFTVLILHAAVLWTWHLPLFFEAALRNETVHIIQHLMFFLTAALFWWALVHGRYGRLGYGAGVLYVFATAMHTEILGALLTFGSRLWYPTHVARTAAAGFDPLADQQYAGVVMWIPFGAVFVVIGLALFAAWLGEAERRVAFTQAGQAVRERPS